MPMTEANVEALIKARTDIARLEAQLQHQTDAIAELRRSQSEAMIEMRISQATQNTQLRAIQDLLNEAKGGWRMVMLMGGGGAMLGGLISWLGQHFIWK